MINLWILLIINLNFVFYFCFVIQSPLNEKKRVERRERLSFLAKLNKKRCEACPIYGSDLIEAVTMISRPSVDSISSRDSTDFRWKGGGESYVHCLHAVEPMVGRRNFETLWWETQGLRDLVHTPEQYVDQLRDIIDRYKYNITR